MQPPIASLTQVFGRSCLFWRIFSVIMVSAVAIGSIDFLLTVYGKYRQSDPTTYSMFWDRRGWLWTHLAGGALTIILGPLQFLTQWPRAYPLLHRWTGRMYIAGMLIACAGSTGLIATSHAPLEIRSAFIATALAWLTTAWVALIAIRRRRVRSHRRWMIRNYLVTLSPITFRVFLHVANAMKLSPSPELIAVLLWLSWLLPLLIGEAIYRVVDRVGLHHPLRSAFATQPPMPQRK